MRFGSEVYRFIFAARTKTPEIDRAFREAVGSFRRMTMSEIRTAKPLRMKIVTVGPRDSVEKLAARMAIHDRQLERFRVLNGLDAKDKLSPGRQVKMVVE